MARRMSLLMMVFWMIFPVHTLVFVNILPPGNLGCIVTNNNAAIYHGIYTIVMGGTLPPVILLVCTFLIWKSLRDRHTRRALATVTQSSDKQYRIRDEHISRILIAQVGIFIVSTIPFMTNNLYGTLTRGTPNKSADRIAIESFAQVITELFVYVFPASSFYSSTLTSRTFRNELIDMLHEIIPYKYRQQQRRVAPTSTHPRVRVELHELTMATMPVAQLSIQRQLC